MTDIPYVPRSSADKGSAQPSTQWVYKDIHVNSFKKGGQLAGIINDQADQGWEYVESFTADKAVSQGCLGGVAYHRQTILLFRKRR